MRYSVAHTNDPKYDLLIYLWPRFPSAECTSLEA